LTLAERRLREGEQHNRQQERVIAQRKREGRDLAVAFSILDTLIENQKGLFTGAGFDRGRIGEAIRIKRTGSLVEIRRSIEH
jgi:hypothetical protein